MSSNCVTVTTIHTICAASSYAPTLAPPVPTAGGNATVPSSGASSVGESRSSVLPSATHPTTTSASPSASTPAQATGLAVATQPGKVDGWMGLLVAALAMLAMF
ncbi:hypothetical protein P152DRAFT_455631 [Eremomyces bilateralis CBS 781.70]|uniref:Uncharacterized protein n=1 Tax=Eremomyces bilateralis CBS 781.70 TaxID=1392243 RepID=A0A6G1GDB9_9PEZI|nr:uncharacterized protein P152DRAFT_455631 [Eremomyces bilateralis CBS 781.70]KAF1815906.1 hypothetical protein P152DRAFT_455631 [Eremomyces bilateralis CBS 781.70]